MQGITSSEKWCPFHLLQKDPLFLLWAPKSLQTVTVAMKLKDAGSLERKL